MDILPTTIQNNQIFERAPEGLLFCLEASRKDLKAVQTSLTALPVHFDQQVYCLDGINAFDPYPFADAARRSSVDISSVLGRVMVSRSFTVHQLQASIERLLPPLLRLSPKPLVLVLGVEHLFLDDSLSLWEREHVLKKSIRQLEEFRDSGLPVLMTHEPESEPRSWWKPIIHNSGDRIAKLNVSATGKPDLVWISKKGEHTNGKNITNLQHLPSG